MMLESLLNSEMENVKGGEDETTCICTTAAFSVGPVNPGTPGKQ